MGLTHLTEGKPLEYQISISPHYYRALLRAWLRRVLQPVYALQFPFARHVRPGDVKFDPFIAVESQTVEGDERQHSDEKFVGNSMVRGRS